MTGWLRPFLRPMWIVARRDFLAIVATPSFLFFLLTPLFLISMGAAGGIGASKMADSSRSLDRMVVFVSDADRARTESAEKRLRTLLAGPESASSIEWVASGPDDAAKARAMAADKSRDTLAVLYGPLASPVILERNTGGSSGRYLAGLADQALRETGGAKGEALSTPEFVPLTTKAPSNAARQQLGFYAVFVLFLLTLLLAGQAVSMLAEEKGNKVIEILAAAVPLESVFVGKLIGLLGVAVLFIAFWATVSVAMGAVASTMLPADAVQAMTLTPAIGWPLFLIFGAAYFTMSFLLLGAVFLGIGAQAGSVREIQMMSLPISIFQVGMFGIASAAANSPGSTVARFAEIFPFSSPFAMAAHATTDPAIMPHLLALAWQIFWVTLVIIIGVRLFRAGVLGGGWQWPRRKPQAAIIDVVGRIPH